MHDGNYMAFVEINTYQRNLYINRGLNCKLENAVILSAVQWIS